MMYVYHKAAFTFEVSFSTFTYDAILKFIFKNTFLFHVA